MKNHELFKQPQSNNSFFLDVVGVTLKKMLLVFFFGQKLLVLSMGGKMGLFRWISPFNSLFFVG